MMEKIFNATLAAVALWSSSGVCAQLPKIDPGENPLIAMYVVNGKPEKAFLADNLSRIKKGGITQFLIYPRSGCEYEYMKEEWLDLVSFLVDQACRQKFTSVWLYDEFNWPSGTANKQTMKINPDYALAQMSVVANADGGYSFKIVRNPQMPDLLNDAPVDCFINLTHEKYYALLKEHFGKMVKGIFTDEPSVGYFVKDEAYLRTIPYYEGLEADYKALTGTDLKEDIICGIRTGTYPYQGPLSKLIGMRFKSCFTKKISDWCLDHGIYATGHMLSEHVMKEASKSNGYILDSLSGLSFPGIDEIRTHETMLGFEWLTFGTGAYAVKRNGNGGMAELFALGPSDMPIAQIRRQIWMSAAFGINRYLLAITQTDLRVKISKDPHHKDSFTGWLNSISPSQPWFAEFAAFAPEAKKAARFAGKEPDILVSVVYPYELADINDVLIMLNKEQLSWKLIKPGEKAGTKFVLRFENALPSGSQRSFAQQIDAFSRAAAQRPMVLENGKKADDVFVRPYKDGSIVIVNFSDCKRTLELSRGGTLKAFTIYPKGVVALEGEQEPELEGAPISGFQQPKWRVDISDNNILRPNFKDSNTYKFKLESPMKIDVVVRDFDGTGKIFIDGKKLECSHKYAGPIDGFKPLYKQASLELKEGVHTVKVGGDTQDYAYLPAVLLSGKFSNKGGVLSEYAGDGRGLDGYVGRIIQSADVSIPANARRVDFDTQMLVSKLFINGRDLGARLYPPFEWEIPADLRGKTVKMELVRYTSIGRAFGLVENMTKIPSGWSRRVFDRYFPRNDLELLPFAPVSFGE